MTVVSFCLLLQLNGYSQGTDITSGKHQRLYLGFSVGPSHTGIINNGTLTIARLSSTKKNSFCGYIDAGYFFSKYIGLSTGLGFSSFVSHLSLDTYVNSFDTTDSENVTYERRISGSNIKEIQKISYLNVPLQINVQIPFGKTIGLFIQTGINFSFPLSKTYNSTGTFTYSGYYPIYNVLLTDIPYEGFKSNVKNNVNGELKLKSISSELISSAGFQLFLQKKVQVVLGVFYNKLLSDISGYSSTSSFRLSSKENHIRSMMEGSNKVSASSFGLKISLRYFLK
jgi:hypothetical protein